jgi:hypothetical protein
MRTTSQATSLHSMIGAGRPKLTLTLPDRSALDSLAQTLARLLNVQQPG